MRNFHIPLFPGGLYHVMNRANGEERLFRTEENYRFFLAKYAKHIQPIAQTLAWCLLPNHYHFLVRIRSADELKEMFERKKEIDIDRSRLPELVIKQFSNWQNSYAKAYNKVYDRKGSLFMDYMRRVEVDKDAMGKTVVYIHNNPISHSYCRRIDDWAFSSYKEYLENRFSVVDSTEIIECFERPESFVQFHQQNCVVFRQNL